MTNVIETILNFILRVALGGLFAFAGILKLGFDYNNPANFDNLGDAQKFANAIKAYQILPDHLITVSAYAFPWLEIIAGVLLIVGYWTRAAAVTISLMLGGFLYAIISVLVRGVAVSECSCFGELAAFCEGPPSGCHVIQDAVMLLVALYAVLRGGRAISIDALLTRNQPKADQFAKGSMPA